MSDQLLTISIDTTLDPLAQDANDSWDVNIPPGIKIRRLRIKQLAGDATSYQWQTWLTGGSPSATDLLFSAFDSASGVTPGAGIDDDNSYTTESAMYAVTQDAAGLFRLTITTTGGTLGGNTYRLDLYCSVERASWLDVAIPAP